ncbi:E3 ubiquitin-protein ligase DTX3L [Rhinatrema bivittatum]|uniref:E3 ubiquitin-protein ligase DTX3L n=1 Tax=Rhinatrema bivittatum TaxID=194408 RepID=UPI0011298953|nr:E3 ubiquitin-protein ligase DTX3L [Rhinatrema bivittatum]
MESFYSPAAPPCTGRNESESCSAAGNIRAVGAMAGAAARGEEFPLCVRVSPPLPDLEKKLECYFQKRKVSEGGECTVKAGPQAGTYLVLFQEMAARDRVMSKREHSLTLSDKNVTMSCSLPDDFPLRNLEEWQRPEVHRQNSADALSQKIFLHMSARLNTHLFSKDQRCQIKIQFPSLNIVKDSDELGIEEVSGDFTELEKVYRYLDELHLGKRESSLLSEQRSSLSSKETDDHKIQVNLDLYDYVMHVFQEEIKEVQEKCNVKIKSSKISSDSCFVSFIPLNDKNNLHKAQQLFISIYQKTVENLSQERVPARVNKSEANKVIESLNAKFPRVLAKWEENVAILLGPKQELLQAKTTLEGMNVGQSWPEKSVRIVPKSFIWEKGIKIDASQIHLLETLLAKEIDTIERRYDAGLVIEKSTSGSKKVNVQFKPKNRDSNLYLCAYESFIGAFQRLMTSVIKKSSPAQSAEQDRKLKQFIRQLQQDNPNVLLQYSSGTLTVTGLPRDISAAGTHITRFLNEDGVAQAASVQPHTSAAMSDQEEPMEIEGTGVISELSATGEGEENTCPICLDKFDKKITLSKCKHEFCNECLQKAMSQKPVCPVCNTQYGVVKGNQPEGTMSVTTMSTRLPSYNCDTLTIQYSFPSGIQTEDHPNPGAKYFGTMRVAYLPNNKEGQEILKLLKRAFDQKLIFTVGQSRTSGYNDVITWNDIHHKTNIDGGPARFGYPDADYLKRVREELKAKGIE